MQFVFLPNLIIFFGLAVLVILVARRLPEAQSDPGSLRPLFQKEKLVTWWQAFLNFVTFHASRAWHFILEGKGLRHAPAINFKIKQVLRKQKKPVTHSIDSLVKNEEPDLIKDENYYIGKIKAEPHNNKHYEALASFYIDRENYKEAASTYDYLCKQDVTSGAYWAKLGYVRLKLDQYKEATEAYEKSVALDASHPNRLYNLAICYERLGNLTLAKETIEKAIALEKNPKYMGFLMDLDKN